MARAPLDVENLDLDHLSDQTLRELQQKVKAALSSRITSRIDEFRLMASEAGFTVTLTKIGEEGTRRSIRRSGTDTTGDDRRRGVSPKFRNPDDPTETWAGRGRKPKWVEDRLAKGAALDDLLIDRATSQESATGANGSESSP